MILGISSDLPGFKTLTFQTGLNILVADTTEASTEGQTRNSAGKTGAIEVVHFLLGADAGKGTMFQVPELAPHAFHATLRLGDREVTVSRRGDNANQVLLDPDAAAALGVELSHDKKADRPYLSVKRWRDLLGHHWFGLPRDPKGTQFADAHSPSFRSMVSYFARRNKYGGFHSPERQNDKQQPSDWQVNLSYLIGLDWRVPRGHRGAPAPRGEPARVEEGHPRGHVRQDVRVRRRDPPGAQPGRGQDDPPARADGELRGPGGVPRLRPRGRRRAPPHQGHRARARAGAPDHRAPAARLRGRTPPEYAALDRIYKAAGVELPGVVLRRFDDVKTFQLSVVENRKAHLTEQVAETQARIAALEAEMESLDLMQSKIMQVLAGKGALDDFTRMGEELAALEMQATLLKEKLRNAEILEGKKNQAQIERLTLHERLQADHRQREDVLRAAMRRIDAAIADLYDDRRGNLIVDATNKGPEFRINIQGDGNRGGIDHMEIFCFDLMLYQAAQERFDGGPGFLIHDSHLFDGVDPRQVRSALLLGKSVIDGLGGQYIVTLNSETLPLLSLDAETADDILTPRLSDDEAGGLFGIRFELK